MLRGANPDRAALPYVVVDNRAIKTPAPDRPDLDALIERARDIRQTPAQANEQRRSFVAGNVGLSNPAVTRDLVDDVARCGGSRPRIGNWMQTFTGRQFWPMDPQPDEIDIRDIAHSLSLQCRYAGHCLRFYSVAEHSVHVANWLLPRYGRVVAFAGLMHDAQEAYVVDVPRPVKPFLPGYKEAEARVWRAVCQRFGIDPVLPDAVHEADNRILNDERIQNMSPPPTKWAGRDDALGISLAFWNQASAENEFTRTYIHLTGDVIQ